MDALPRLIADRLDDVRVLCERYQVKKLLIFGSAVKGTFDEATSDVDFLVEFFPSDDPLVAGRRYLDLWKALKELLGRKVDLVEVSTIDNVYFAESVRRAQLAIYDAA